MVFLSGLKTGPIRLILWGTLMLAGTTAVALTLKSAFAAGVPPVQRIFCGAAGYVMLGFVFAAMSGIALKEQFCFRIPFLRLVPLILAPSLIPVLLHNDTIAGAMHIAGGALFAVLAGAKAAQPLHFDIGDKRHYLI